MIIFDRVKSYELNHNFTKSIRLILDSTEDHLLSKVLRKSKYYTMTKSSEVKQTVLV